MSNCRLSSSANPHSPYCITITSSGLGRQFGCRSTIFPRIHSFVPVAAYYSSLNATRSKILPSTSSARAFNTTTPEFRTPVPTGGYKSYPTGEKISNLPPCANAGIGSNAGLVMIAGIALIAIWLREKRRRAHVSPIDGGAGSLMEPTINMTKGYPWATQTVEQRYQPQPQGYKGTFQPVQQYHPQLDNTKFVDSADIPPYFPAPDYSSGSQHILVVPIPSDKPKSDTTIVNNYPSSTVTPAPPLSPPSYQMHQQKQSTAQSWDHPPISHISPFDLGSSDLHHQDISLSHSEFGVRGAGAHHHHTGTRLIHTEQGAGIYNSCPSWNHSELYGAGEARAHYPGPHNNNHSELGP